MSFKALPALKAGTLEAAMLMVAPVCGLRPVLAARALTRKEPKPTKDTESPVFSAPVMESKTESTALVAAAFDMSVLSATASISSDLFT